MSVLFKINGVPVFDEIKYARSWGQDNGLLGFHTHERDGRVGYMAGVNHAQTTRVEIPAQQIVVSSPIPENQMMQTLNLDEQSALDNWVASESVNTGSTTTNRSTTTPAPPTITTPSGGGGGGGY